MIMSRYYELCRSHKYLDCMNYINHETNKVINSKFFATYFKHVREVNQTLNFETVLNLCWGFDIFL